MHDPSQSVFSNTSDNDNEENDNSSDLASSTGRGRGRGRERGRGRGRGRGRTPISGIRRTKPNLFANIEMLPMSAIQKLLNNYFGIRRSRAEK